MPICIYTHNYTLYCIDTLIYTLIYTPICIYTCNYTTLYYTNLYL